MSRRKRPTALEYPLLFLESMRGYITERDYELMERVFPGIMRFYWKTLPRPVTFLELLWRFESHRTERCASIIPGDSSRRRKAL
jgi:hypothetical protein